MTKRALRFGCLLAAAAWMLDGCGASPQPLVGPTVASVPMDPLDGSGLLSCPVYLEERCEGGKQERCDIYDTRKAAFVDQPDPLLRRVFLYDRWYDLHSSPLGLTAERRFQGPMPGSTPESVWSSSDNFSGWDGMGDAAIWTGAALVSDIFRYLQTGTAADYQRMEEKVRTLLRNFEVTGIPGYLARYHLLLLPLGSPNSDQLILRFGDATSRSTRDNPIESLDVEGLPAAYTEGVPDGQGNFIQGVPLWHGHPSIDQYTGPMTAFPLVYNLLKDEALKARIVFQLTCYLKRLRRLEIINLQENPQVLEEITAYLGGSNLNLDPDDIDLLALDRLVMYYHAGINDANREGFNRGCPGEINLEPSRVLDANDSNFLLDMLELVSDMGSGSEPRMGQIDHFYFPNARGGDASHLMHLAAMAYYFTGEEHYRKFLFDELVGNLHTIEVAMTAMAFRLPDWCFRFYGDHITYGAHWQFITLLRDPSLKRQMIRVMHEEMWQKALFNHHSAKFNLMYGSVIPDSVSPDRATAIQTAVRQLQDFGGNDGVLDAPRRTYSLDPQSVIDLLPEGVTVRCPTEEQRGVCERKVDFFGIPLESETISRTCDGRAGECILTDGKCADGLASEGLPPSLRTYADFMWQRSPFDIGASHAVEGQTQSPGRDLTEPYWMARHYGYIAEGAGQVLAWREMGNCP